MRFAFLFLAGCTGLYATSVATVSCTLGSVNQTFTSTANTLTRCQLDYPAPGDLLVEAEAYLGYLTVGADAGVSSGIPSSANASSSAYASETETFRSAGPPRPGGIEFLLEAAGSGADNSVSISDGVHQYSLNCPARIGCSSGGPQPMPFELGTNFTVTAFASAVGACFPGYCSQAGAGVNFLQLFEADGTTPVGYFLVTVPEPGEGDLLLLAIPVGLWRLRRRSCGRVA